MILMLKCISWLVRNTCASNQKNGVQKVGWLARGPYGFEMPSTGFAVAYKTKSILNNCAVNEFHISGFDFQIWKRRCRALVVCFEDLHIIGATAIIFFCFRIATRRLLVFGSTTITFDTCLSHATVMRNLGNAQTAGDEDDRQGDSNPVYDWMSVDAQGSVCFTRPLIYPLFQWSFYEVHSRHFGLKKLTLQNYYPFCANNWFLIMYIN